MSTTERRRITLFDLLLIGSAKIDGRFGWSNPATVALFVANGVVLLAHHAGWAVAVSWCTLVFIGRWRPEPSWVDRWGRALGCTWIILGPMASLLIDHSTWFYSGGEGVEDAVRRYKGFDDGAESQLAA